ncbi:uncharacterized protein LOC142225521 [Haematobia irritans]|uniref:uncharacterized protein LOC142225521 n=1 Tax=Haematobia irritans TaxID=7368 RepID=UPI003F4F7865
MLHIAPLPRVTLEEIEKGRVSSDIRDLINRRRAQLFREKEDIRRRRNRLNTEKMKRISIDRQHNRLVRERKDKSRALRLSLSRQMLRTAMEALQRPFQAKARRMLIGVTHFNTVFPEFP